MAQEKYQDSFDKWLKNYYDIDEINRNIVKRYISSDGDRPQIEKFAGKKYIVKQIVTIIRNNDECLNLFAQYMEITTDEIKKIVMDEVGKIRKKEIKEKLIKELKLE